jgi:iron-sulfur cluster repair protein YtfE (RIC family)
MVVMASPFPTDILLRLGEEHARIRVSLAQIEAMAREPVDGPRDQAAVALASALSRLALLLASHNANEEAALRPLLSQTDAWGPTRVEEMARDHAQEHAALRAMLEPLKDLCDLERLQQSSLELVHHLRDHLETEERSFLNRRVLHDDLVTSGEDA